MRVQLARWGNSTGLRLPKALLDRLRLRPGAEVDLTVTGDVIELRPVRSRSRQMLDRLVEEARRVGPAAETPLVDWGPDRGSEAIEDEYARGEITLEDVLARRDARRR